MKCDEDVDSSSEFECESCDESVMGVHFEDSEEEKMKGFD